jgi:hypothetical protein
MGNILLNRGEREGRERERERIGERSLLQEFSLLQQSHY